MTIPSRFIEQVGPKVVGFREEILASTGALGEVGGSGWVGFPAYGFVDLMMGNCGASSWKNFVFPNEAGEWVEVNPRMGKKHLSAILHLWNKRRYIRFIFIVVFFNFFFIFMIVYEEHVRSQRRSLGVGFLLLPFVLPPSDPGIERKWSGLHSKCLSSLRYLAGPK